MPLISHFEQLGCTHPSSSNDRDLYSTRDGYRYTKGLLAPLPPLRARTPTEDSLDYTDEQHSPPGLGMAQHQAPDTTSPSPPHVYPTNGSSTSTMNSFAQGNGDLGVRRLPTSDCLHL